MNRWIAGAAAATAWAAAAAETAPLSPSTLSQCAGQVLQLRTESAHLLRENAQLDTRRSAINARSAQLDTEAARIGDDDLKAGLALHEQRKRHHQEALAFNADIEQLKREIAAVNTLKRDYDRRCANRPYRRADLEALPPAQRDAMRAGLDDVSVPYLD